MADLAGSPALCRLAQTDADEALRGYALTARERARLASVVGQPGMAVNCTIHRTTRLVPLDTLLPLTCAALGAALGGELDAYWAGASRPAIRFETEGARFVAHLESRVEHGRDAWPCPSPALVDLARLELAMETLRIAARHDPAPHDPGADPAPRGADLSPHRLHPDARVLGLGHEPGALLAGARARPPDLASVPRLSSLVVLTREADQVSLFAAPPDRVGDLEALARGEAAADWLIEFGLAVPMA